MYHVSSDGFYIVLEMYDLGITFTKKKTRAATLAFILYKISHFSTPNEKESILKTSHIINKLYLNSILLFLISARR